MRNVLEEGDGRSNATRMAPGQELEVKKSPDIKELAGTDNMQNNKYFCRMIIHDRIPAWISFANQTLKKRIKKQLNLKE